MLYKDHLERQLELKTQPKHIISLVPSLTELLHDLGLEKRIAGVTKFCIHPYHYKSTKTIVGGTKKVDFDAIKTLKPDFILCSKEENTAEMVEQLEKIAPVFVTDINTFDDALDFIIDIGKLLDKRVEAQLLVDKISNEYHQFLNTIKGKRRIKTAYFIWKDPWMVAGKKTFINDMMKINRLDNVFANHDRYPEININDLDKTGNPELLLFSDEPYKFDEEDAYEVLRKNKKVLSIFVDGRYFSWYGSRLLAAFDYFKTFQERLSRYE